MTKEMNKVVINTPESDSHMSSVAKASQISKDNGHYDKVEECYHLKELVIVVDPFSTGAVLAQRLQDQGFKVVCVYSDTSENMKELRALPLPESCQKLHFVAEIAN